jgi:predicted amidohydrolase YtcJ
MRTPSIFALSLLLSACVEAASPSPSSPSTPLSTPLQAKDTEPAELVLTGGIILTMQPGAPRAEAVAIRGGRFTAVGTADEVRAHIGPGTRVIELKGRTMTPGLVDAHCHLYGLGIALETLPLRGQKSPAAIAELVREQAKTRPEGEWISGRGWDQNLFTPAEFPGHAPLDAAAPKHPVALRRIDGHAVWANAAAMRAAGVGRATADPPGGKILRDAAGEPTGVFIDHAMALIDAKMPPDPPALRERRILRAAEIAVSLGLTGVHEMGIDDETVAVYRKLALEKRLPLRVHAYLSGEGRVDSLPSRKPDSDPDGTAMFVLRGVKLFADGALGSRGAALLTPYNDDPSNTGLLLTPPDEMRRAAKIAAESGFQLAVHAIGDRANRIVLDAFEAASAAKAGTPRDLRFRIEHAQVVAPEDLGRFAKLGVIASMQPTHATSDMPWAEARIGPSRSRGAYAWRSILSTGAHIAFGSDFPVEETSPLLGVYAAVTRQDAKGNPPGGFRPEERVTLDEALRAFTAEPAYAAFVEGHRGAIAKGFVADLTVFNRALTPDKGVLEVSADIVMISGRAVRGLRAE